MQRIFLIPFNTVPSRGSKSFDGRSRADVLSRCIVSSLMVSANTRNDTVLAAVLLGTPGLEAATLLCCGQHMRALHPTEKTVAGIVLRALPPAPGHPGDLQQLDSQGLLNSYEGSRSCCQGTWLLPGGIAAAMTHLLSPAISGPNPAVVVLSEGAKPIDSVLKSLMPTQQQQQQEQQQQEQHPRRLQDPQERLHRMLEGQMQQQQQQQQQQPRERLHRMQYEQAQEQEQQQRRHNPPSSIITILGDDAGLTPEQEAEVWAAAGHAGVAVNHASLGPMQLLASQCITLMHHYLDLAVGGSDVTKPRFDPHDPWLDKVRPCRICYPPGLALLDAMQQQQQQQEQQESDQQQHEQQEQQ